MEYAYLQLLQLLTAHAQWTLAVVFAASFLESMALIGTFIPGSTAMFIAGAFAGTGTVNLGWLFVVAIAGAVGGDALSYWIGHRYRDALAQRWPFSRYPDMFAKAHEYFLRNGARSVILARFVAPLRAVVPIVAGMAGMTPMRFFVMNVISALIWAPAHILPGVVFGASLQIAGAVSFRLVVIVVILALAGWLIWRFTRILLQHLDAWASASRRSAARWAQEHHGAAGRRLARLLDPAQPAFGAVIAITALLPIGAAIFSYVLGNLLHGNLLAQVDHSVRQFLYSIHSVWADAALARIETLGSTATLAALIVTGIIWMAFERHWRTIAYWIIAAAVSQVLIFSIRLGVHHAPHGGESVAAFVFPSDRVATMVIVYGFLMFLLVRRVNRLQGAMVASLGNVIIVAATFAGLYFDRFLFSDAIGGAALASIWIAAIVLMSLWRYPNRPTPRHFMPSVVLAVLAVSFALQPGTVKRGAAPVETPPVVVSKTEWTGALWKTLACYRFDMKGERREPMTLQWAANAGDMRDALRDAGWSEGAHFTMRDALSLVAPQVNVLTLPLLPKLNNGMPSPLVFARVPPHGDSTRPDDQRDVLRFWPTGYALGPENGGAAVPIWTGSVIHERLRRGSWPFNVLTAIPEEDGSPLDLMAPGEPAEWRVLTVPGGSGCQGRPVTLIVSEKH
ncbi:VTT domain-containing protein [Paraburkholderia dinghuensis]|uniref:Phosphoesterase n=1 Tax=Paraburkholderia dinghuensis TaxID=2305225 RepID=A0A3N6N8V9_9BURK|nr:VTT domain-containing protein [Paraburkholderia dinghuensis]RQH05462.1 phosphoesterase [Paraburkholderia dinghuensis]